MIAQGDLFWLNTGSPRGSGPGFRRPHVVVQNDVFNASRIQTTVLCAITSNLERAKAPGNVLLRKGEANLPRPSVINVSQIITVDKSDLREKIGTLSHERILEILSGLRLVTEPREPAGEPDRP